jgi:rhodanese-related sulfurtransferase
MIMQTISRADLQNQIAAGNVVVLEALPANYYADGHIPGALNLPLDDIDALAATLVPDHATPVVTYCTGTSCPNSRIAAEQLRKLGYTNVRAYEAGKQDWTEAGLLLESAAIA